VLRWALIFLLLGIVAAVLGFGDVAGAAFAIAKILFFLFLAIFLVLLLLSLTAIRSLGGG
jgi:uncharacterized membrane protein YtjA (UPF0391 family)